MRGISQLQRFPLRREGSQPHTGLPSLAVKINRDSAWMIQRVVIDPGILFKGLSTDSFTQKHLLSSNKGTGAGKVTGAYWEELN